MRRAALVAAWASAVALCLMAVPWTILLLYFDVFGLVALATTVASLEDLLGIAAFLALNLAAGVMIWAAIRAVRVYYRVLWPNDPPHPVGRLPFALGLGLLFWGYMGRDALGRGPLNVWEGDMAVMGALTLLPAILFAAVLAALPLTRQRSPA